MRNPHLAWGTPRQGVLDAPFLELEAGQAPGVFNEAVATLAGKPSEAQVIQAAGDIAAACDADYEKACQFLKEQTLLPERIEGTLTHPQGASVVSSRSEYALVVLQCRIDTDDRVRDCQVIEDGSGRPSQRLIAQLSESRYRPWTLAGHAVATPYTFMINLRRGGSRGDDLLLEQRLGWARLRVAHFPQSSSAWVNLAMQLAVHTPEDPDYPKVLAQAHALAPSQKWIAAEMAWLRIQAGQHTAALMVLRPVIRRSSMGEHPNPYVLETAAAAHFGLNQCTEALAEQQRAVDLMPKEWLAPEQERFQRKLQDYQSACATPKAVSAVTGPR
ncbi:tetratricopeptide repeat protein [Corallococcus aberystwythensis]|uniref:tetratricopeptide repeat protein n=1 Tax=Corallococcus aberystwythensis TaxID=2316722 RepID=UPI0011C3D9CC|nr:hypothetical protein [Corallococcus aberystwythensis]